MPTTFAIDDAAPLPVDSIDVPLLLGFVETVSANITPVSDGDNALTVFRFLPTSRRQSCCGCCGDYYCPGRVLGSAFGSNTHGVLMGTTAGPKAWCYDPDPGDFTGDFAQLGWANTLHSYGRYGPFVHPDAPYPTPHFFDYGYGHFSNPPTCPPIWEMWYGHAHLVGTPGSGFFSRAYHGLAWDQSSDEFRLAMFCPEEVRLLYSIAAADWDPCGPNTLALSGALTPLGLGTYPATVTLTPYTTPPGGFGLSPTGCECQNAVCPGQKLPLEIPWTVTPAACTVDVIDGTPATLTLPAFSGIAPITSGQVATVVSGVSLQYFTYGFITGLRDAYNISYDGSAATEGSNCPPDFTGPAPPSASCIISFYLAPDGNVYGWISYSAECSCESGSSGGWHSAYGWQGGFSYTPACPSLAAPGPITISLPEVTVNNSGVKYCTDEPCNPLSVTLNIG